MSLPIIYVSLPKFSESSRMQSSCVLVIVCGDYTLNFVQDVSMYYRSCADVLMLLECAMSILSCAGRRLGAPLVYPVIIFMWLEVSFSEDAIYYVAISRDYAVKRCLHIYQNA